MKEKEGFIYWLREKADRVFRRAAGVFIFFHITPNALTLFSLFLALVSGIYFYLSGKESSVLYLFLAGVFLGLSSLLDALDGPLARVTGTSSDRGDFLDHAVDRYADVLFIVGIVLGGYVGYGETGVLIGLGAIVGILLTSYFGVQGQALGLDREYRGLLGRTYRLILLILAVLLSLFYFGKIDIFGLKLPIIGWLMVLFAILGILTAIQRTIYIWKNIPSSQSR